MNFLIDCGIITTDFLNFSPRDNLSSRTQPLTSISTEIDGINNDLGWSQNEAKRIKLDPSIEPNGVNARRIRGQFLVEAPEFSGIDWSTIDFILITNYKQILALPYVTEYTDFRGKIYATEPTVIFGCQLMKEFVHLFGESTMSSSMNGMEKFRSLSTRGTSDIFTGFTPEMNLVRSLYSLDDVQNCVDKIQQVRYEEILILFELQITAHSSGYCLGGTNWLIDIESEKIAVISSSSTIANLHPLPFSKSVLDNVSIVILNNLHNSKDNLRLESTFQNIGKIVAKVLRDKGNVLFPCTMNGIMFDIIDILGKHLNAVGLGNIPFYAISPIAEESLKFSNISGEWMCEERQQKMYMPENPMAHKDMIDRNLLFYAARADSSLQEIYHEPCVVFAGHPSLRSGATINFIRKWESEYDYKEAISAFEDLQIMTEYIPIDIRLTVEEATNILQELKPRQVLFPREIVEDINSIQQLLSSSLVTLYGHLNILNIAINSQYTRLYMSAALASEIYPINVGQSKLAVVKAKLRKARKEDALIPSDESNLLKSKYFWGKINILELMNQLNQQIYGCRVSLEQDMDNSKWTVYVESPKIIIKINNNKLIIKTEDNDTRKIVQDILFKQLVVL
ncbi:403_t:CDS:10 [Diversispora eburnea]|uniref:403_t:CDS:1 n=1 Tax=Diversispora eburnea TaxID=1213867 RepID=A0A9N8WG25_9GLOM|nr:403_t:CDS:10 [Diversispora eburnea]